MTRLPSIRSSLTKLVAVSLMPALLVGCVLLYYSYERERVKLGNEALAKAHALLLTIDRDFSDVDRTLRVLGTSPFLELKNLEALHEQAQDVLKDHFINNIVLINAEGRQVINTSTPYGLALPMTTNLQQLGRVIAQGKSDISDLFVAPLPDTLAVNVAIPVRGAGKVTHSLVGLVLPKHLQKILDSSQLPPDRIASIFDSTGHVAARTRDIGRFIGQSVTPALQAQLQAGNQGIFESLSMDGTPVLIAFARSETSHWGVAIGIPISSLTADLRHWLALLAASTALILVVSLGLAWVMSGRIARAVRSLAEPAAALGYGHVVSVPELPILEVNEVAKSLSKASIALVDAGRSLTASEARMRGILESVPDAILAIDEHFLIVVFNPAAAQMFGHTVEQALGLHVTHLMPERFRPAQASQPDLASIAGMSHGRHRSGNEFPVEVSYASGKASGVAWHTLVIRDITSRMRDYEALERSNLDLQQFAYVASHDLKTPLRSISGFIQLLERKYAHNFEEGAQSLISRTQAATRRLEQLTDDLLSFARINSDVTPFAVVNLSDVTTEVIHLLDAVITETGATVVVAQLPAVRGARTQLVQLLLNLISNAMKYCKDRSPVIRISAVRQANEWVVSVEDNGIGIEPKHYERIFEVFKRLHVQHEYAGTGIGLAICRQVVHHHGGKIWASSVLGQGSTFHFTIPAINLEGTES